MEKYQEYKPSKIQWIGDIPKHWEDKQLRSFLFMFTEKGHGDAQLLSVTREQGVIERDKDDKEENHNFVPEDLSGYKYIEKGDFAINKMKAWQGSYAVSEFNGIVSPAYYTCKLRGVNKEFFSITIRSKAYVPFFTQYSKGIRVGQWDLNPNALKTIPFFLPPLAEQEKIVSYLEGKSSKIDAYVVEKEKEIHLLQELKQKTIADAVTKGLNPDVKMKDYSSLIASSYPNHWRILRNKSFLSLTGEKVGNRASEFVLLSLTTKGVIVRDLESGKGKFPKDFDTYQFVRKGELVFCLFDIDETPRTVGLVDAEGMLTGAYSAFKVNSEIALPEYVYNYFLCVDNIKALKPYYSGLRKTVRADKFLQIYIPLPPLDEQRAIVAYIDEKCRKIDKMVTDLQAEIDYMKEYKQRLIADCVTGQINVQNER